MSEIAKYEAQKKKLDGLCEEHDLTFRLRHDRYPITLTLKPLGGMDQQMTMLEMAETKDYISPDASLVFYRKDGEVSSKINGTFTISEALRNKFKNIYLKISDYWLQYFFREVIEKELLQKSQLPVIDEDEAEYDEDEETDLEEEFDDDHDPGDIDDADDEEDLDDDLFEAAKLLVRQENKASFTLLQRRLNIGYSKAGRLMKRLEDEGVVGPYQGSKPREVLPYDVPEEE